MKNRLVWLLFLFASGAAYGDIGVACGFDQGTVRFERPVINYPNWNGISYSGLKVAENEKFDIDIAVDFNWGAINLSNATPTEVENPYNKLNLDNLTVHTGCLRLGAENYWLDMNITQTEPTVNFSLGSFGKTYDFTLQPNWEIDYDNSFSNDPVTFDGEGGAGLASFDGEIENNEDGTYTFSIEGGLSGIWAKSFSLARIDAEYDHFGEQGDAEIRPVDLGTSLKWHQDRFNISVQYDYGDGNSGDSKAFPTTDESGAFNASADEADFDNALEVRMYLDEALGEYRLFTKTYGDTDVGYTLNIEDTLGNETETIEKTSETGDYFDGALTFSVSF